LSALLGLRPRRAGRAARSGAAARSEAEACGGTAGRSGAEANSGAAARNRAAGRATRSGAAALAALLLPSVWAGGALRAAPVPQAAAQEASGPDDSGAPAAPSPSAPTPPAEPAIAPFAAHYIAEWKNISVATSDLVLQPDIEPEHYRYTWTITAHGIFKLVYRNPVTQKSWLVVEQGRVRPLEYHGDDGSAEVNIDFNWAGGHARGTADGKPVDLVLKDGTQDVMSIQIQVMEDLRRGRLPPSFPIVDNNEVKDFRYTREGVAHLETALGALDAVIVASQRAGSDRILRMWFAPSLGFVPLQAERTRGGKLEFAMRIRTLKR
jgi:hypothetical protein